MSSDGWYRNKEWTTDIEREFRSRLVRSRSQRPQYLKLQAGYLAMSHPDVALRLTDEYIDTGDTVFMADALTIKARALTTLGRLEDAALAFVSALDWEDMHPGMITNARLDYPELVARHHLADRYDEALRILAERVTPFDLAFPVAAYITDGSRALILHEQGDVETAAVCARRALKAAAETASPFRYHQAVGLVGEATDDFAQRLERVAAGVVEVP